MRILHINGNKGWGGSEQQMFLLISELGKMGHENLVFGPKNSKNQHRCEEEGIRFFYPKTNKINKFQNYKLLKKVVAETKPAIIHLHTSDALTLYVLADRLFGLKTKTVFSKKSIGSKSSFLSKLKYNYKGLDAIICVSKWIRSELGKDLNQKSKDKVRVIYDCVESGRLNEEHAVDLREKHGISQNTLLIGNIANHNKAKDLMTFVNTVSYAVNELKIENVRFIQVGQHSKLTPDYLAKASEQHVENSIVFTNAMPDAYLLNRQFALFLLTSEREGGPTVALEAMLYGVPVVSTRVGIMQEIIKDGDNGFIADVRDYKALAESIKILADDAALANQFAEKNKGMVIDRFNSLKIATEILELYKSL